MIKGEGNTHLTSPECVRTFPLTSSNEPGLSLRLQSGITTVVWVSVALKEYFVVYAAGNTFLIVLGVLLVNGEAKETMEASGMGIGSRDIPERERHPLLTGLS